MLVCTVFTLISSKPLKYNNNIQNNTHFFRSNYLQTSETLAKLNNY